MLSILARSGSSEKQLDMTPSNQCELVQAHRRHAEQACATLDTKMDTERHKWPAPLLASVQALEERAHDWEVGMNSVADSIEEVDRKVRPKRLCGRGDRGDLRRRVSPQRPCGTRGGDAARSPRSARRLGICRRGRARRTAGVRYQLRLANIGRRWTGWVDQTRGETRHGL